ncbi:energy-coupling factor transport system substrate-specific component [Cetobacterium ceti]|uniref:Energy-coupling factor transport system substrate-specific component n=1 Tax=Cetobacterium ceti TaxID=180163 RepID=A0A1T4L8B2_9FUSO|nr:ECF-type riboflavin transporter substrate-binding protein [Cetobacterium ceti]SJZ50873.1 energy-coupling factor transport system substrate-specific component [Cetobacterium ceti]
MFKVHEEKDGFRYYNQKKEFFSTKNVVAIGIGAALYSVLSAIMIPIGPNTSFRIAVALLTIFGVIFGPMVGFFVGFVGHALNDMIMWGSVWFSWVFLSAVIGLFAGFINNDKSFNLESGKITKKHIFKMYIYAILGMIFAGLAAYVGDVYFYGEPPKKVWIQIALATFTNFIVTASLGIPIILAIGKSRRKHSNLKLEN